MESRIPPHARNDAGRSRPPVCRACLCPKPMQHRISPSSFLWGCGNLFRAECYQKDPTYCHRPHHPHDPGRTRLLLDVSGVADFHSDLTSLGACRFGFLIYRFTKPSNHNYEILEIIQLIDPFFRYPKKQ
jgi:hypothetical protein